MALNDKDDGFRGRHPWGRHGSKAGGLAPGKPSPLL